MKSVKGKGIKVSVQEMMYFKKLLVKLNRHDIYTLLKQTAKYLFLFINLNLVFLKMIIKVQSWTLAALGLH